MGAWIETLYPASLAIWLFGRSLMGAWIETPSNGKKPQIGLVAPLWERGLKHCLLEQGILLRLVAPLWERGLNHSVDKADGKVIVSLSAKSEL